MKDLTAFGGDGRRQIQKTDSDQFLSDKSKSADFRKGMRPFQDIPGYGDPDPEPEPEEN